MQNPSNRQQTIRQQKRAVAVFWKRAMLSVCTVLTCLPLATAQGAPVPEPATQEPSVQESSAPESTTQNPAMSKPAVSEPTPQELQEDLDTLVQTLVNNHPDFYRNTSEQAVREKKAAIEAELDHLSLFDFSLALSELTALAHDSHTSVSIGRNAMNEIHLMLIVPTWMEDRWRPAALPAAYKDFLGCELLTINGHTMDELLEAITPMICYDTPVYQRRQFGNLLYVLEILEHYDMVQGGETTIPVKVRDGDGVETVLDIPVLTQAEMGAMDPSQLALLSDQRRAIPDTERDTSCLYKLLDLSPGVLYMQYNQCREDENLPMETFAAEVEKKLETGDYFKFIIDLRYNGGGSDGVLYPIVYLAQQFIADGNTVYVLAGSQTFSSALINTVQLKDIGAFFIGEPTGGSVDHFGSVSTFELPHSQVTGQYSNKFIDLSGYFEAAKPYGVESFVPDLQVNQTLYDYLDGVDTVVQYIKKQERFRPILEAEARVSPACIIVDGKPTAARAYSIAGSHYVNLRDCAMILSGSTKSFNVSWNAEQKRVTLSNGVYTPVGGELQPLANATQTARRARADMYVDIGGDQTPLVLSAYEIAGNHYVKLRGLCQVLDMRVDWDGANKTVALDTTQSYWSA